MSKQAELLQEPLYRALAQSMDGRWVFAPDGQGVTKPHQSLEACDCNSYVDIKPGFYWNLGNPLLASVMPVRLVDSLLQHAIAHPTSIHPICNN